jgi:hypothetical protein
MITVGSQVHIARQESPAHVGTYTVLKVNPTTYRLRREGDGALLRAAHNFVQPGPLPKYDITHDSEAGTTTVRRNEEHFETGAVVTIKIQKVDPAQLWVVTGETARGYRVYPLGGSTRYYTGIPSSRLIRVTEIDGWRA